MILGIIGDVQADATRPIVFQLVALARRGRHIFRRVGSFQYLHLRDRTPMSSSPLHAFLLLFMANRRPILVTGPPRSGTTWVGRTLLQAPCIRYVQEPFNREFPMEESGLQMPQWLYDVEFGSLRPQLEPALQRLVSPTLLERTRRDVVARPIWKRPARFIKYLCRHLTQTERVLLKDPIALMSAGWLADRFQMQVVCMIRNPWSFAASMKRADWGFEATQLLDQPGLVARRLPDLRGAIEQAAEDPGDLVEQACLLWNVCHSCIRDYQARYPDWLFINQEELALRPVEGFQEIFSHLNISFGSQVTRYLEEYSSESVREAETSTRYQPRVARETVSAWKETLTAEEIQRIRDATTPLRQHFYPDADPAHPHVSESLGADC